jgi:hypothetical protein
LHRLDRGRTNWNSIVPQIGANAKPATAATIAAAVIAPIAALSGACSNGPTIAQASVAAPSGITPAPASQPRIALMEAGQLNAGTVKPPNEAVCVIETFAMSPLHQIDRDGRVLRLLCRATVALGDEFGRFCRVAR